MRTVTWEEFYPFVYPMVQGAPQTYVDAAIRASTIELCQRSHIWNQETMCGDILKGERAYRYNNLNDMITMVEPVVCIIRQEIYPLKSDGTAVPNVAPVITDHIVKNCNLTDMNRYAPMWRLSEAEFPSKFYMKDSNTIVFKEKPTKDNIGQLHMLCAVKPSQTATECPKFLFDDWAETIAAGALFRLHSMKGRPWSDPTLVALYRSQYRDGISRAKEAEMKSYTRQSLKMAPPKNSIFDTTNICG